MSGRTQLTQNRIYIITQGSTKWSGKVLLFDVTSSYVTNMSSTTTSHSVEQQNRSISDHIYNNNSVVTLTAYISDAWDPQFSVVVDKAWQNYSGSREEDLWGYAVEHQDDVEAAVPGFPSLPDTVDTIIKTGEGPPASDYVDGSAAQDIIRSAYQINGLRDSNIINLQDKGLLTKDVTDASVVNDIGDAVELLQQIRANRVLCTLVGKYRTMENMTFTSMSNPLQAGAGSQALYLNLNFEQQRVASTQRKTEQYDVDSSEIIDPEELKKAQQAEREKFLKSRFGKQLTNIMDYDDALKNSFNNSTSQLNNWIEQTSSEASKLSTTGSGTVADGLDYIEDQIAKRKE
jgi:hypothetical protein